MAKPMLRMTSFIAVIYATFALTVAVNATSLSLQSGILDCKADASCPYVHFLQQGVKRHFAQNINDETPRIAVCISGQLGRLELQSKVDNMFRPLSADSDTVHVFLALELGDPKYVNHDTNFNLSSGLTETEAIESLGSFYQASSFLPHREYSANISRWAHYAFDKQDNPNFTAMDPADRLASHMSQQSVLRRCVQLVEEAEERLGEKYTVVIKMRDNTLAMKPFTLQQLQDLSTAEEAVVTKACSSWGGVNDKVMVLPRKHLSLLGDTFDVLVAINQGDPLLSAAVAQDPKVGNIELLLMRVLELQKIPHVAVDSNMLPFVDARSKGVVDGQMIWCPVDNWKDCKPDKPWEFRVSEKCHEQAQATDEAGAIATDEQAQTTDEASTVAWCVGGVKNGDACCDLACGTCGGADCSVRPGGRSRCCSSGLTRRCEYAEDVACTFITFESD